MTADYNFSRAEDVQETLRLCADRLAKVQAELATVLAERDGFEAIATQCSLDLAAVTAERDRLRGQLDAALAGLESFSPLTARAADALADEVAVLVRRNIIDSRSPAADALLDYRNPPSTPRADRMAILDAALLAERPADGDCEGMCCNADVARLRADATCDLCQRRTRIDAARGAR